MKAFNAFVTASAWLMKAAFYISCAVIVFSMLLTTADVTGRYLSHPVPGTFELTEMALLTATAGGIAWLMLHREHIGVDFITRKMSPRSQAIMDAINSVLMLIVWTIIGWQLFIIALSNTDKLTMILEVPTFPFRVFFSFGAFLTSLALVILTIESIRKAVAAR